VENLQFLATFLVYIIWSNLPTKVRYDLVTHEMPLNLYVGPRGIDLDQDPLV